MVWQMKNSFKKMSITSEDVPLQQNSLSHTAMCGSWRLWQPNINKNQNVR